MEPVRKFEDTSSFINFPFDPKFCGRVPVKELFHRFRVSKFGRSPMP